MGVPLPFGWLLPPCCRAGQPSAGPGGPRPCGPRPCGLCPHPAARRAARPPARDHGRRGAPGHPAFARGV